MNRNEASQNLALTLAKFQSYKPERAYELSLSYEIDPAQFDVDKQELREEPFMAPHLYRIGLRCDGEVVFDGVFENPLEAMDLMIDGMKAKIADSSWVDWMATMDKSWAPRVA